MSEPFQDATDAELAVLNVLWMHEEDAAGSESAQPPGLTIRDICQVLYPRGKTSDYATVQKLLDRLEVKSCVTRRRSAPAHRFHSALSRDELIGRRLESVAQKVCGGSLTPLLTHLVQHQALSAEERLALRSLLDELPARKTSRGKKKKQ